MIGKDADERPPEPDTGEAAAVPSGPDTSADRAAAGRRGRRPPARPPRPGGARAARPRRAPEPTGSAAALDADTLAALEEERTFLLDSLRDLNREREAGDIDDDDYAALRDDYTGRAAAVLRTIEGARPVRPAGNRRGAGGTVVVSAAPGRGRGAGRDGSRRPGGRRRRTALSVVFIVAVAAIAGAAVATFSGQRLGGSSGPTDVAATSASRIARAQQLEMEGKATDALKLYDSVLKQDPANAVALTYRGWLLARAGLIDPAMQSLDKALAADPRFADAHFFRGMVLYKGRNQPAEAIPEFETFLADNPPPEAVSTVQGVLDQARQDAAKPQAPPGR